MPPEIIGFGMPTIKICMPFASHKFRHKTLPGLHCHWTRYWQKTGSINFYIRSFASKSSKSTEIMPLNPRESGEYIVKNAKHLSIDTNGVQRLVQEVGVVSGVRVKVQIFLNFATLHNLL